MIKLVKEVKREQGLYLIVTELDAKSANINNDKKKRCVENHLVERLEDIGNDPCDATTKYLKEYLIERVFTHYINMISILDYVYNIRKSIERARTYRYHNAFLFVTRFVNYVPTYDDEDEGCGCDCAPDKKEDNKGNEEEED